MGISIPSKKMDIRRSKYLMTVCQKSGKRFYLLYNPLYQIGFELGHLLKPDPTFPPEVQ